MSTGSAPIATSTPVNFGAGPVSPPSLTLAAGPGPPHQEQPVTTSAAKVTSYPAVLKGRTAASPPNPNLVPSGKIPPPVPPRGTGQSRTARSSEEHRGPGTATSTSSMTSSRGDEAAIITRYRLHETSSILHHLPTPDYISTAAAVTSTNYSAATCTSTSFLTSAGTSFTATANNTANSYSNNTTTTTTTTTSNTCTSTVVNTSVLHARTSTPAYLPPRYDSFLLHDRSNNAGPAFESIHEEKTPRHWDEWPGEDIYPEEEEFVSVEKVDGSFVIRTSPHPFRPERGNFNRRESNTANPKLTPSNSETLANEQEGNSSSRAKHMAKFTYFLNPASRPELMNYKMSRKDKKHSETYYERMKRKQKELEASISTITLAHRNDRNGNKASKVDKSIAPVTRQERVTEEKKIDVQRLRERRRDSKLLRKIKEKSARRRKKLAPEPTSEIQSFAGSAKVNEDIETSQRKEKIGAYEEPSRTSYETSVSLRPDYENNEGKGLSKSASDGRMLKSTEDPVVLKGDKRTFLVTKVSEHVSTKFESIGVIYSSKSGGERDRLKDGTSSELEFSSKSKEELRIDKNALTGKLKNEETKEGFKEKSSNVLIPNTSFLHSRQRSFLTKL